MRGRIDRGVQAAVTASGLMVLMTLMLIFVYLLFAVLPLFKPASLSQAQPLPFTVSARRWRWAWTCSSASVIASTRRARGNFIA